MKSEMSKNHLFLHNMSRKRCIFPHDIPTIAKRTPENPMVGPVATNAPLTILSKSENDGRNEHSTAMVYVAARCIGHRSRLRHKMFPARWKMLA